MAITVRNRHEQVDSSTGIAGPRATGRHLSASGLPWIGPALLVSVGIIYYCIVYTGYTSTLRWNGISRNPRHIGIQNYDMLVHDALFWSTILHTAAFFLVTFVTQTILGVTFAAVLHTRIRLIRLYKVLVFLPLVIAPATMAPVFREIWAEDGQLNSLLRGLGLDGLAQPWLAQSSTALPVVMSIQIWQYTGLAFILYYAAMSQIDNEILEAARLDGAGNLRVLASIVWPSVRGTTVALAIVTAISALKNFDVPYLVTSGGPNHATEFLATLIYRESIPLAKVGYGAAISMMLLVLAIGSGIVLQLQGRERRS